MTMADQHAAVANEDTDDMDAEAPRTSIDEHQRTFDAFITLTKWTIVAVVLTLVLMAWFLV